MFAACGIMHRRSCLLVTYRPKHAELIEITNKLLLLHLVGCLYKCIRGTRSHKHHRLADHVPKVGEIFNVRRILLGNLLVISHITFF